MFGLGRTDQAPDGGGREIGRLVADGYRAVGDDDEARRLTAGVSEPFLYPGEHLVRRSVRRPRDIRAFDIVWARRREARYEDQRGCGFSRLQSRSEAGEDPRLGTGVP